jgi:hypothetical protein
MNLDMRPQRVDLAWARKDSFAYDYYVVDEETNLPIDFTGTSVILTVNTSRSGSGADLFTLSTINVLDTTGILQFKPSAANNDLAPGKYYYDVEWAFGSSIRTIIYGIWRIGDHISN